MKNLERVRLYLTCLSIVLILAVTSCSVGDSTPPEQITNLSTDQLARLLEWTAPGDNGPRGRASIYFIRFFDSVTLASLGITLTEGLTCESIEQILQDNFSEGIQVPEFIQPQPAGISECFSAPRFNISGEIFCYLIQSSDEVGNLSQPSNATEVLSLLRPVRIQDPDSDCPQGFSIGAGNFTNTQEDEDDGVERNDILIGDPCSGMVYIFFGRSNIAQGSPGNILDVSLADVTIIGSAEDGFGASVTGIGNFGGSGPALDEIGIGAPGFEGGRGEVFIILGNNDFGKDDINEIDFNTGAVPDFLITGENQGDEFGVETVGFANVDRRGDEFFVGAPGANSKTGKTYRFDGNDLSGDVIPASDAKGIIIGQSPGDTFGSAITDATGISGSSSGEYAISSEGSGKVNVFFTNVTGTKDLATDTSDVVIIQGSALDRFGMSISGGGDIDEDGEGDTDLVIGSPGANMNTGSVFLYSGADLDDANNTGTEPPVSNVFTGIEPGDLFGTSLVILNNLTPEVTTVKRPTATVVVLEESNADFAVGAPGSVDGIEFVFLGRDDFPPVVPAQDADVILNGITPEMNFGLQTQALGDVNGDMIGDFGASGNDFVRVEF